MVALGLNLINGTSVQSKLGDATAGGGSDEGRPVKRKRQTTRKPKDPNAPKRPLTPFFAFLREARPAIVKELHELLGEGKPVSGKAVAAECTRRWHDMSEADRVSWQEFYDKEKVEYEEEVNEYKKQRLIDTSAGVDDVAAQLAAENDSAGRSSSLEADPKVLQPARSSSASTVTTTTDVTNDAVTSPPGRISKSAAPEKSTKRKRADKADRDTNMSPAKADAEVKQARGSSILPPSFFPKGSSKSPEASKSPERSRRSAKTSEPSKRRVSKREKTAVELADEPSEAGHSIPERSKKEKGSAKEPKPSRKKHKSDAIVTDDS